MKYILYFIWKLFLSVMYISFIGPMYIIDVIWNFKFPNIREFLKYEMSLSDLLIKIPEEFYGSLPRYYKSYLHAIWDIRK